MSPPLPRYFLLRSCNSKLVRHVKDRSGHSNLLLCDGEDIASPHSRFYAEKSNKYIDFVHIRCCYNNKYWAADAKGRVYAGEQIPEEGIFSPNCTLFCIKRLDSRKIRIRARPYQYDVSCGCFEENLDGKSASVLSIAWRYGATRAYEFDIVDWEAMAVLPKYLAFKGDNGKYLQVIGNQYMQFKADDRYHKSANFEVYMTPDGKCRLKNGGRFWRAGPNWIYSDSWSGDTDYSDEATLFWPVWVEKNVVALRNMDNNYFCRRTTWGDHDDCLCADNAGVTISREARLEVEETVSSRKIYGIRYRENDCRFYNESIITVAQACVSNDTDVEQEVDLELVYQYSTSHTWNNSVSKATNIKMGFKIEVPKVAALTFDHSTRDENNYRWGEKKEFTNTYTRPETVTVKPGSKVKVTVVATRRYCDVPFSYTQDDRLDDGTHLPIEYKDDGVYTGVSCIGFKSDIKEYKDDGVHIGVDSIDFKSDTKEV